VPGRVAMEQAKKATQKSPNQNPKEIEPKRLVSNVEPMTHKSIIIGFMSFQWHLNNHVPGD